MRSSSSDYDMLLTEHLVQGVDVWINTPRRPWEASGTSGMKVLVNGGINLSELDGWWAEAYTPEVGWALGDGQEHGDDPAWDAAEAEALYDLLEREVIPEFYARDEQGIPTAWVARMRESMARLTPRFSADRTVREYTEQHYLPAAAAYRERAADKGAVGRQMVDWRHALEQKWPALRFGEVKVETDAEQHVFEVQVYLNDLDPNAVRVELYADGVNGGGPVRQEMKRVRQLAGAAGGYAYRAAVPAARPASGLYGARDTALCRRCGSAGSRSNPVAAVIRRCERLMTRHNVPLGRILGIPIGLDYSWFLIFALLTWMLAGSYYPAEFKNWPPLLYWFMGAVTAIMLFVSVLLHELGHSVVALRYKVPVRSITLFIFGGVAQIGAEPPSAIAEFFIAIAGPIVSLVLAVLFSVVQPAVAGIQPFWGLAKYLAYINFALVLFNLIPGYPLDGGRVFRAIVWAVTKNMRRATLIAANVGRFFGFLFIFARRLADVHRQLWRRALDCLHRLVSRQRRVRAGASSDVSGTAGGPHGLAGHEQSLRRRSRGPDAATVGGRTHPRWRPALLPGQSRSGTPLA